MAEVEFITGFERKNVRDEKRETRALLWMRLTRGLNWTSLASKELATPRPSPPDDTPKLVFSSCQHENRQRA